MHNLIVLIKILIKPMYLFIIAFFIYKYLIWLLGNIYKYLLNISPMNSFLKTRCLKLFNSFLVHKEKSPLDPKETCGNKINAPSHYNEFLSVRLSLND